MTIPLAKSYEIRAGDGSIVAVHVRATKRDGSKEFRWEQPNGTLGLNGTPVVDLPLYGTELISQFPAGESIVLVEGEKACDALRWAGVPAVGTVTGASATPSDAALAVLHRRAVRLWPDNDDVGRAHMDRIAEGLERIGVSDVAVIAWAASPPRGDAADLVLSCRRESGKVDRSGAHRAIADLIDGAIPRRSNEVTRRQTALRVEPWPAPMGEAAMHGLVGTVVRALNPHTEADPANLVVHFLAALGNIVGRAPHLYVGSTRHTGALFVCVVGKSSKARKGEGWTAVRPLFGFADGGTWLSERVQSGLSSGEGLINAVRDPAEKRPKEGGESAFDNGVEDKRLLVVEQEFGRALRVVHREANTLSAVIRQAWESGDLRVMTKKQLIATGAHISIVGHITSEELSRELTSVDVANGFGNRFLWVCTRRSKLLPDITPPARATLAELGEHISLVWHFAQTVGEIFKTPDATKLWAERYPDISEDREGFVAELTARGEVQVLRIALLYALLDQSATIDVAHLEAALAVWEYCARSTEYIFGGVTGDPVADRILRELVERGRTPRTAIGRLFGGHQRRTRIDAALDLLGGQGLASKTVEQTGGRNRETWSLIADA